jgi:CheY-like chemotaxis protein
MERDLANHWSDACSGTSWYKLEIQPGLKIFNCAFRASCRMRKPSSPLVTALSLRKTALRSRARSVPSLKVEVDIVLAEFAMPEMSGVELARTIKATRPTLPVIIVIGYKDLGAITEFDHPKYSRSLIPIAIS